MADNRLNNNLAGPNPKNKSGVWVPKKNVVTSPNSRQNPAPAATTAVTTSLWIPKADGPKNPVQGHNFKIFIQHVPMSFAKISGLENSVETEPMIDGGKNSYTHALLKPFTGERVLTLERGLIAVKDINFLKLMMLGRFKVGGRLNTAMTLVVYDNSDKIAGIYSINGASVRKWSLSPFDAQSGNVVVESFEIVYETVEEEMGLAMMGNWIL